MRKAILQRTIIAIFATSFVVALSGALMPGPLLALNISEAARRGFWAGPMLILGHGIAELAVVVAVVKGLGQFFKKPLVAGVIGLVGGLVLLWMGFAILRSPGQSPISTGVESQLASPGGFIVLWGALVSVANPYWVLWWATIGMSYLLWSMRQGIMGVSSFFTGHILADLGWYSLVSLVIATGAGIMSDAVYRGLLIACGIALLGLGGYFMFSGVRFFVRKESGQRR